MHSSTHAPLVPPGQHPMAAYAPPVGSSRPPMVPLATYSAPLAFAAPPPALSPRITTAAVRSTEPMASIEPPPMAFSDSREEMFRGDFLARARLWARCMRVRASHEQGSDRMVALSCVCICACDSVHGGPCGRSETCAEALCDGRRFLPSWCLGGHSQPARWPRYDTLPVTAQDPG